MRNMLKTAALILLAIFILGQLPLAAAQESDNPLIVPYTTPELTKPADKMVNILLLGLDFGTDGYWGSGYNRSIESCHTDAVMVVAINLDKKTIDLVSLPRDTLTYVPDVRGIYKLNAAVNCADSLEAGFAKTTSAVEWLLGGIQIDYFFAVDMSTMIALGDAIGGIDIELEMSYAGHSGTQYHKGMQHLDGVGITDYLRARTNATVNGTDIGRTNRQRQMMLAIFEKLRGDEDMIWDLLDTAVTLYDGFFTDITTAVMVQLALMMPTVLSVDAAEIDTHVITGNYRSTLDWNFTYTDQDNRIEVLKTVYGIDADPIPYASTQYARWLVDTGFTSVHFLAVSQDLRTYIAGLDTQTLTTAQQEACAAFEAAYQEALATFDTAANSLDEGDTHSMESARIALRDLANACAALLEYPDALPWAFTSVVWWEDLYINEYQVDWR